MVYDFLPIADVSVNRSREERKKPWEKKPQFISSTLSTGTLREENLYLCFFTLINFLNAYLGKNSSIFPEA